MCDSLSHCGESYGADVCYASDYEDCCELNVPEAAGAGAGALVVLIAVLVAAFYACCRRKGGGGGGRRASQFELMSMGNDEYDSASGKMTVSMDDESDSMFGSHNAQML